MRDALEFILNVQCNARWPKAMARHAALKKIEEAAQAICRCRKITLQMERLNADPPAVCDPALVKTIFEICRAQDMSCQKMTSRAYHDSLFMAQVCPRR